jgi:hypothetical protein
MSDKKSRCQHRDSRVVRARYDANGHYRVKHAYDYCHAREDLAVDLYGLAYCADHRSDGDFGFAPVDLDQVLRDLRG